jgi:hypothetical protein
MEDLHQGTGTESLSLKTELVLSLELRMAGTGGSLQCEIETLQNFPILGPQFVKVQRRVTLNRTQYLRNDEPGRSLD